MGYRGDIPDGERLKGIGTQIRCPNCGYEGKVKIKSAAGLWILWLILCLVSLVFWPLLLAVPVVFLWLVLKSPERICPRCSFAHPMLK